MNRVLLSLLLLAVLLRALLPSAIRYGLNWYLGSHLESYQGHIADFDLTLYRGAYQIQGLRIWKKSADEKLPLIQARNIDLSLAWRALFQGRLLGDLAVSGLRLRFVDSESTKKKQFGTEEKNWNKVFSSLIPIEIESLKISDGEVHFLNRDYRVPVDLSADRLEVEATNLRNTEKKGVLLPSHGLLKGRLQKDAPFVVKGRFNLLETPVALSLDAEIKDFTLARLNDFFLVYGPFTFAKGSMSLFSEVATREGKIKGYIKPFFKDVKMVANKEHFISTKHELVEFLMGTSNVILRNSNKDTAARIEFEGPLKAPKINTWDAFWSALKNAFGSPLKPTIENKIDIKSVPR